MTDDQLIGNRIGRIQILGLLGQGGMGQVYEGFDERLERRVAVKRLDDSSRMNDLTRARFEQEAKLLSRLDHPNICRIFDLYEEDGHSYLVLELIDGTNLRELMGGAIDVQQKLRIVEQIAGALAAAHSEGVVHRDLKPDNVMVTDDGVVKILDFGIAHSIRGDAFQDKTLPGTAPLSDQGIKTGDGRAVGTPRFMSPEQARGEIVTPASDLFSLGLLMQELLTGEEPYDPDLAPRDLLKEVNEGRSRPVVGLSKPLTEVIERLKSHRPADRMTAAEVVRKLKWIAGIKQRRLKKAIAACVVFVVVVGVVKYVVDLRRERLLAVEARADSEELVAFLLDDLARSLSPLGHLSVLEKVSDQALDYFDDLPKPLSSEAAFNRGKAFGMVADVHLDQGQISQAIDAAAKGLEIHQALVDRHPENSVWQNAVAEDLLRMGGLWDMKGEGERAKEALITCRDIVSQLVVSEPENARFRENIGEASYSLGLNVLFVDPERAIDFFIDGIDTYRRLSDGDPTNLGYRYRLAVLHGQGLGQAFSMIGREDKAFEAVTKAHDEYSAVVKEDSSNAHWLFAFAWEKRRLSDLLIAMGRLNEAWDLYSESLAISANLVSLEPRNMSWREGMAVDYFGMADIRRHQGRLEEALGLYENAGEIYRDLIDIEPGSSSLEINLAGALDGQGIAFARLGEVRSAEIVWRRALRLVEDCPGTADGPDLSCLALRATLMIRQGLIIDAEPLVERLAAFGYVENMAGENLADLLESKR